MLNKRKILQPILDEIEPDWVIVKPDPLHPGDRSSKCIFQSAKPKDYREAFVHIPDDLFQNEDLGVIERLVRNAIKNAKPKF
jgi:hypothetical protein